MAKSSQRRSNPVAPGSTSKRQAPNLTARKSATPKSSLLERFRKKEPFIFGRRNFIFMGFGLLLIALGLLAMSGGRMPDPETWDANLIYSPRRITLAPMLMVAGFVVVAIGIFLKPNGDTSAVSNTSTTA